MKILCVCDQIDPIVYNSEIKERFGDVDYILSAGDLPMEYIDFIVFTLLVFNGKTKAECSHCRVVESISLVA